MERWTTRQAAEHTDGKLSSRQLQTWCALWIDTKDTPSPRGLKCEKEGEGRRATFYILPADLAAFLETERKRGWPRGRKRKQNGDGSINSGKRGQTDSGN